MVITQPPLLGHHHFKRLTARTSPKCIGFVSFWTESPRGEASLRGLTPGEGTRNTHSDPTRAAGGRSMR